MIRKPIGQNTRILLGIASVCVVVACYAALSAYQHHQQPGDTTIPNLSQFIEGFKKLGTPDTNGDIWLWEDTIASLTRLGLGLLGGVLLSFLIGIAMGCFTSIEAFLLPPVSFLAKIPPTAMLAVYFVIFGRGFLGLVSQEVLRGPYELMFVAMIALGIFPTLAQAIFQAARKDVSEHAVFKAYTLGASWFEVIWEVVIRQILPRIIENVRLQVGPAMVFLIAAEWWIADVGFGYTMRMQTRVLNMSVVYTYLILLGIGGFLFDWCLSSLRRWLCPWFGE